MLLFESQDWNYISGNLSDRIWTDTSNLFGHMEYCSPSNSLYGIIKIPLLWNLFKQLDSDEDKSVFIGCCSNILCYWCNDINCCDRWIR